jgi:hypothetical protein
MSTCLRRHDFIVGLGGATALPLAARADWRTYVASAPPSASGSLPAIACLRAAGAQGQHKAMLHPCHRTFWKAPSNEGSRERVTFWNATCGRATFL